MAPLQLVQISGNSYYVPGRTNVGVYKLNEKQCIIIDSGLKDDIGKRLVNFLKRNNLETIGIINTHSHVDHFGGNNMVQKLTGCKIYATKTAKCFIEDPTFHLEYIYGAHTSKSFGSVFGQAKPSVVTDIIEPGEIIEGTLLKIVGLHGHTRDQIGVETPDKVLYLGDSIVSEEILLKYGVPFIHDVGAQLKTFDYIDSISHGWYLPCHGDLTSKDDIRALVKINRDNLVQIIKDTKDILSKGATLEGIKRSLSIKYETKQNPTEDRFLLCSVSAILSYIDECDELIMEFEDYDMIYKLKV